MAKNNRPDRATRRTDAPRAAQPHANHASGGMAAHPADQHQESPQGIQHQGTQHQGTQQQGAAAATAVATGTAQREHTAPAPTSMKSKKGNQPKHSPKR